ncbi:unnamed protein product [Parnassius apollo]|uniref:(apollo) hypothetical protein n=1 Tax=Parnassius apollo TaxID=110799 RepID=A0A8S3X2D1_PARAO|nr:unnamed protein product [Parnassius apollo]
MNTTHNVEAMVFTFVTVRAAEARKRNHTCPHKMIPIIVRVWCESGTGWLPTHVPVTPQTTGRDVLECCREPGDEPCVLFSVHPIHGVHVLRDTELPLEVAATLGPEVQFVLKYVGDGSAYRELSRQGFVDVFRRQDIFAALQSIKLKNC